MPSLWSLSSSNIAEVSASTFKVIKQKSRNDLAHTDNKTNTENSNYSKKTLSTAYRDGNGVDARLIWNVVIAAFALLLLKLHRDTTDGALLHASHEMGDISGNLVSKICEFPPIFKKQKNTQ